MRSFVTEMPVPGTVFGENGWSIVQDKMIVNNKPITASMKQSGLVIGFIWFIGFLYAIREAIVNDLVEYDLNGSDYVSCIVSEEYKDTAKYFIFIDISILFLIPLIIIVSNYARVIKKLSLTIADLDIQEDEIADKQALKAIKMLVTLMILFCICTVSPMILKLYSLFAGKFANFNVLETSIYMFSYSNSWFNLIVFAIFREDLREGAKNLFCKKTKKEKARDAWATKVRPKLNLVKADIGDVSELAQQRRAMMMMEF